LGEIVFEIVGALSERLTKELAQSSPLDLLIKVFAGIILAGLVYVTQRLFRRVGSWTAIAFPPWWASVEKISRARSAIDEYGPGLWLTIDPHPPSNIDTLKNLGKLVFTVANLKGGVGKSTLTANLAAFFANPFNDGNRPQRRVLVIDLDFQGSCSSMLFGETPWRPGEDQLSHASELISGSITLSGPIGQPVEGINGARGVSAFYDLARIENREMIRWLIGDEQADIRYRLARILLSDAVLNKFDVVLIDAPPRLTTASVQALCASTHVLIPTVLDPLSADDPVGYFGRQLKVHEEIWPQLKVMGVVGTMTNLRQQAQEEPLLRAAGDRLRTAFEGTHGRLRYLESVGTRLEFTYEHSIRMCAPMARAAASGVPYVKLGDNNAGRLIRAMIDNFGTEVERRWHL
jgi:cellulose biosynthesis protein BcsQ